MSTLEFSNYLTSNIKYLNPFALNLTKNMDDSNDLIQDTVLRALKNKDKFREGTNLKAWLYTMMRNIFINDYRKRARRKTIIDTTDNLYYINSGSTTVTNTGEQALLKQEIDQAMSEINSDHLVPFQMYYNGYKYDEISETLKVPLGTVKSRIFLARKALKKKLIHSRN